MKNFTLNLKSALTYSLSSILLFSCSTDENELEINKELSSTSSSALTLSSNDIIALKSTGGYLSADDTYLKCKGSSASDDGEKYTVENHGNDVISLISMKTGLYVSSEFTRSHGMTANRTTAGAWEKFTVEYLGGDLVAFRNEYQGSTKYMCSEGGNSDAAFSRTAIGGAWEEFTIEKQGVNPGQSINGNGYGAPSASTGDITFKNWYLSVPIDRGDGSKKATSIYYSDLDNNSLTSAERAYFDFNSDGSFKMNTKFTGYTTSGYKSLNQSGYCRTEFREYYQGNQTTSDNWYMNDGTHILESTLKVTKCEGEGKSYVAQIHGTSGDDYDGNSLSKSPATIKVAWEDDEIEIEYYTEDGVSSGEWTSNSGVGKATIGNVGNNKFTVRIKIESGKFYLALYCAATGVDTGYVEYYDYDQNGYKYQNYFKTGNYFRHDANYTSESHVTLYSATTYHD